MKQTRTILVGLCLAALTVPGYAQDTAEAAPKAKKQGSHAQSLLKIARDLRSKGQVDIARQIETQAKRLLAAAKKKPGRYTRAGVWGGAKDAPTATPPKVTWEYAKKAKPDQAGRWYVRSVDDKGRPTAKYEWRGESIAKATPPAVKTTTKRVSNRWVANAPRRVAAETAPRRVAAPTLPRRVATRELPRAVRAPLPDARPQPPEAPRGASSPRHSAKVAPLGTLVRTYSLDKPAPDEARVSIGRSVYRYQPVPTGIDSQGRVKWRGLPPQPRSAPLPGAANRSLEKRVESLSKEVRAMRRTLDQLNSQLRSERAKKKLIR